MGCEKGEPRDINLRAAETAVAEEDGRLQDIGFSREIRGSTEELNLA